MLGDVEVKPSSLQIPISTIALTKSPLLWSMDNTLILTTQIKLYILELECSHHSSSMDLQFKRYSLETPETINPHMPSGPDYVRTVRNSGAKMVNELTLPHLTTSCRRAEVAINSERLVKPSQISGEICHHGYKKTKASSLNMSKRKGCLFCTLTYDHKMWIISKKYESYNIKHDLAAIWNEYIETNDQFSDLDDPYKCCDSLLKNMKARSFYDMFWTPTYEEENGYYSMLLTITGSGHLVAFKIPSEDHLDQRVYVQNCFALNFSNIMATHFHPTQQFQGILALANYDGVVSLFRINLEYEDFATCLGTVERSRVPIHHVYLDQLEGCYYLLMVAYSTVLMAYIIKVPGTSITVLASTFEMGSWSVTAIEALNQHVIYASLSTGVVVKYNLIIDSEFRCIKMEKEQLFNSEQVSFKGFAVSPNKCLWAIFETLSVPYDHLVLRSASSIHIFGVNKPESLYNFALSQTNLPIERKRDVIENIRLYTRRGLFNCLPMCLLAEEINPRSNNYLMSYLALANIYAHTISKHEVTTDHIKLAELVSTVQSYVVSKWVTESSISSSSKNVVELCKTFTEVDINPLSSSIEANELISRCMLCGRRQNNDIFEKNLCQICIKKMDLPKSEDSFVPHCSICGIYYSPPPCITELLKSCIYCNETLSSPDDIPRMSASDQYEASNDTRPTIAVKNITTDDIAIVNNGNCP